MNPLGRPAVPTEQRFWSKVLILPDQDDCWPWLGGVFENGYGHFAIPRKRGDRRWKDVKAHRYSYELHHGSIPKGKIVMHTCDNKWCVRPEHLRVGTLKENTADMDKKGRRWTRSTFTEEDFATMKRLLDSGMSQAQVGAHFGVWQGTISYQLRRRKTPFK